MNKIAIIATVWLTIAGLLGGAAINAHADRCDAPQRLTQDDVQSWLWWPVLLAVALVADSESIAYDPCDDQENDHAR